MTDPGWLDPREARAWRGHVRLQAELSARLNRHLQRDSGLSDPDYGVLAVLSEAAGGRLRSFELRTMLGWEKSRLSHHVARMERRGLVTRRECPTDARGAFVVITDEGRDAIEEAAPRHVAAVRRYFIDLLSPEQLDALGDISEAVLARLAEDDDRCD